MTSAGSDYEIPRAYSAFLTALARWEVAGLRSDQCVRNILPSGTRVTSCHEEKSAMTILATLVVHQLNASLTACYNRGGRILLVDVIASSHMLKI